VANALKVAFKTLTKNDFYRINSGGLEHGGGQAYLDFRRRDVSVEEWEAFFSGASQQSTRAQGPAWTFAVRNLGIGSVQPKPVVIYQRRQASVSLGSQKLPGKSEDANRLEAWRPDLTGFPAMPGNVAIAPDVPDALVADLRVFLVRDDEDRFWAGWIQGGPPVSDDPRLMRIFELDAGIVDLNGDYSLDEGDIHWPFREIFGDQSTWDEADVLSQPEPEVTYSIQKVRKRDQAAARSVRKLYNNCQISGDQFLFLNKQGKPYLEVHHLIPLGKGGADSTHNMIVVSGHIHKMLHHANVSEIDLSKVADNKLPITIDGTEYTITWHPQHAATIAEQNQP
jgi:5-methylcytosine-specific restriction protein A